MTRGVDRWIEGMIQRWLPDLSPAATPSRTPLRVLVVIGDSKPAGDIWQVIVALQRTCRLEVVMAEPLDELQVVGGRRTPVAAHVPAFRQSEALAGYLTGGKIPTSYVGLTAPGLARDVDAVAEELGIDVILHG